MHNQAPGHFHCNILRGLYWKIVPFLQRWIQPLISTRRSRYSSDVRINQQGLCVVEILHRALFCCLPRALLVARAATKCGEPIASNGRERHSQRMSESGGATGEGC